MARDKRKEGAAEPVKALSGLYPARSLVDEREAHPSISPRPRRLLRGGGSRSGVLVARRSFRLWQRDAIGRGGPGLPVSCPWNGLPDMHRLESMARDPTIDSALKMHIGHALSVKSDSWEAVAIDPVEPGGDKIVDELKAVLQQLFNEQIGKWGYNAALYGTAFVRGYGEQGKGILNVRSDYYTHPRFIKKYEKAGQLAGSLHHIKEPPRRRGADRSCSSRRGVLWNSRFPRGRIWSFANPPHTGPSPLTFPLTAMTRNQ